MLAADYLQLDCCGRGSDVAPVPDTGRDEGQTTRRQECREMTATLSLIDTINLSIAELKAQQPWDDARIEQVKRAFWRSLDGTEWEPDDERHEP